MTNPTARSIAALALALGAPLASANPVSGAYFDGPDCDSFGPLEFYEELGTGMFPTDELISAVATTTQTTACPMTDDPTIGNVLLEITNLSGTEWQDLFYVADPGTTFSNVDGFGFSAAAPGALGEAAKIDIAGVNRVLIFESMSTDGVFEVGETWGLILQDWSNAAGFGAADMGSLDFAGASAADFLSTGSIVAARPIPTPATLGLFGGGLLAVARRRRA